MPESNAGPLLAAHVIRLLASDQEKQTALAAHAGLESGRDQDHAEPSGNAVISVSGLVKRYGDVEAVRGIDFEVTRGETFGVLGPNGAGKTTTIKILCTLASATAGRALVAGHDPAASRDAVRRNIGLVFQDITLDSYLTAAQNLRFHAELYGVRRSASSRSWASS